METTRKTNYIYGSTFNKELGVDGLGCYLYEQFIENKDRIFQIDGNIGQTETYGSVLQRAIRVALKMKENGITEEDTVVLCAGNTMDSFIPILGTQLLHAAVACLDPSQSIRDAVYLLNLVEPKMIFVQDSALDLIETAAKEFLFTPKMVVMGNDSFDDFLQPHPHEDRFVPEPVEGRKKTAIIFFSSGTSGMPKGICVTGHGLLTSVLASKEIGVSNSVGFHATSFYWISAMMITLLTILHKGRKIILPKFDVETFFKAVEEHKINHTMLATHIVYEFSHENVLKYDLSSLKLLGIIGSVISGGHMQRCRELLPHTTIFSAYGLTEASGYVLVFPSKKYEEAKKYPCSCGLPQPGITVKVVDPETEDILGPNQPGEVRFISKYQFTGYFKKDSSEAFDHEGFVRTGDIGYYDKNKYFYICDRIKDMFKYKSWHIVPASIEGVILQHPAVKEVAVVGIPHPLDGDLPMALVILKKGFTDIKSDDLINFVNERVLDREKLRAGLRIVDKFPKTPNGKVPRGAVRKMVIEGYL